MTLSKPPLTPIAKRYLIKNDALIRRWTRARQGAKPRRRNGYYKYKSLFAPQPPPTSFPRLYYYLRGSLAPPLRPGAG